MKLGTVNILVFAFSTFLFLKTSLLEAQYGNNFVYELSTTKSEFFERETVFLFTAVKNKSIQLSSINSLGYHKLNRIQYLKSEDGNIIVGQSSGTSSNPNIKLIINLKKIKYIKFEPVLALFEYINLGNEPDTIHDAFDKYLDVLKVRIENLDDNTIYDRKNLRLHFTSSCTRNIVILPGDTLKVPLTLNAYGKAIESRDEFYFGEYGYFPPGKYKAIASLKNDCSKVFDPPLESNEIYFEVEDIASDELSKIWVNIDVRNRTTSEIINEFKIQYERSIQENSNSTYTEHLIFRYLNSYAGYYFRSSDSEKQQEINFIYKLFLKKYPNSYYTFNRSFIYVYLINNNADKEGIDEFLLNKLREFISEYPHIEVSRYLKGQIEKNKLPWKSD